MLAFLLPTLLLSFQDAGSVHVVIHGGPQIVSELRAEGFDAWSAPRRSTGKLVAAEAMLASNELSKLREGFRVVSILERSRPFREINAARRRARPMAPPDPSYKTPKEIEDELARLERTFPKLAKRYDLNSRTGAALTHGGRRIYGLRVSDNPSRDEDEPRILLVSNHHARELNSIEVALFVAEKLLKQYSLDAKIKKLVDENEIWLVPTMNPDGLDYVWTKNNMWRKNRRDSGGGNFGVDLNRNYPYFWSRCGSSRSARSDTYHGPSAGSEPETRLMLAFAKREGFERLLDIHSYSRDIRTPFNPLVRAAIPTSVRAFYDPMHRTLAGAMSYRTNTSCCCGGDMEFHHATYGTLAFLVELGTAFQPKYSETQAELTRVWPGLRLFLEKPAPMRGHVRSLRGRAPLVAQITVQGSSFANGEKRRSAERDGRYAVWLGSGTYDVVFTAPGHLPQTQRVTLTSSQTLDRDVLLIPDVPAPILTVRGSARIGTTSFLELSSSSDAGRPFFVGASFSDQPAIRVGPRYVPLAPGPLFDIQLQTPTVFANFVGQLDTAGRATSAFHIPNWPVIIGLPFHFCGMSFEAGWPMNVRGISNGVKIVIGR